MPIQFNEEQDGKELAIHVSGKLTRADYPDFVSEFERLVRQHGHLRVLFDMTNFHGWDTGAAWEDIKFGLDHIGCIERMAMVGDKKSQHGMAVFFQTVHESHDSILRTRRYRRSAEVVGRSIVTPVALLCPSRAAWILSVEYLQITFRSLQNANDATARYA